MEKKEWLWFHDADVILPEVPHLTSHFGYVSTTLLAWWSKSEIGILINSEFQARELVQFQLPILNGWYKKEDPKKKAKTKNPERDIMISY